MTENRTFRLRVTYGKTGRLAMLSHLEVTHALERIVRRAKLPFALSCGFSPHMKIAFGSALPVGIGGTQEVFDVTLADYVAPDKALELLAKAAPESMMPVDAKYVEPRAKAASVAYPYSLYEARLRRPFDTSAIPDVVEVVRKNKTRKLNVADYLVGTPAVSGNVVSFQLESKDTGNLRPDVFLRACTDPNDILSITRVRQSEGPI